MKPEDRIAYQRDLVDGWNKHNPIGTKVMRWAYMNPLRERATDTVTTSEAWLMGGHSAMVMVEGVAGGVSIESILPLNA